MGQGEGGGEREKRQSAARGCSCKNEKRRVQTREHPGGKLVIKITAKGKGNSNEGPCESDQSRGTKQSCGKGKREERERSILAGRLSDEGTKSDG